MGLMTAQQHPSRLDGTRCAKRVGMQALGAV